MEVLLFRALIKANIDPDTAQEVVDAVEEHIDMAVGQANRALEGKLDGMKATMEAAKSSVDQMRVWLIIVTSIIAICALAGSVLGVVAQFMK